MTRIRIDATLTLSNPEVRLFGALVALEEERRSHEKNVGRTLDQFEESYFGSEVGFIRRTFNSITLSQMKMGGRLLDYGCGGNWWKEDYWPRFEGITAVEISKKVLDELSGFPNVKLVYTGNGLVDPSLFEAPGFDVVLSSSVVGYILPNQAQYHLRTCFSLLRPGGQLVLTRVRAYTLYDFLRSNRLAMTAQASFTYGYSKTELMRLLDQCGFENIEYSPLGVRLPVPMKVNQLLYRCFPKVMGTFLPKLFPFLKIQHCFTAIRPK